MKDDKEVVEMLKHGVWKFIGPMVSWDTHQEIGSQTDICEYMLSIGTFQSWKVGVQFFKRQKQHDKPEKWMRVD